MGPNGLFKRTVYASFIIIDGGLLIFLSMLVYGNSLGLLTFLVGFLLITLLSAVTAVLTGTLFTFGARLIKWRTLKSGKKS